MTATRIDKWLWHARFYRTRALAQAAASAGRVRVNGARIQKASAAVRTGDVLTLVLHRDVLAVRVLGFAERRGAAPEARQLYEILADETLDRSAGAP